MVIKKALTTSIRKYANELKVHEKTERTEIKQDLRGCPRGVMVKAMDCGIVVREFVLQSRYCVHFQANTLRG